jgi:hypothetical protein
MIKNKYFFLLITNSYYTYKIVENEDRKTPFWDTAKRDKNTA